MPREVTPRPEATEAAALAAGAGRVAYLIFDGAHYDPLTATRGEVEANDMRTFSVSEGRFDHEAGALALASEAQRVRPLNIRPPPQQ